MSLQVRCPSGHKLNVAAKHAGRSVRCPACQLPVAVPAGSIASPAEVLHGSGLWSRVPGYRADRGRRETVYFLAGSDAALALLTLVPVLAHWNLAAAPGWAKLICLVALLQLAYALWLALAPDWSSLWVATLTLAAVAALYATGVAITLNARPNDRLLLDLAELIRTQGSKPTMWCLTVVLLASLLAYLSGMASYRWHKAYRLAYPKA